MKEKLRRHIEKNVSLSDEETRLIMSYFAFEDYKKKDILIQQGSYVNDCYYIASGLLKLVYNNENGKEQIVSFAMEDWWESDFSAYFKTSQARMSLQCIEDTTVFALSLKNYQKLIVKFPKMACFFLEKSNSGHTAAQNRIISLLTLDAQQKYQQLLEQNPSIFQRVPKTLLASYLGVSRETLSRLQH
ncbi:Crp/Fnr family transcriptional regulator [Zunongwangia endophytica]|uniref:Crp/Fnr family transcriptional regulator n=1 Tax=Zunongwangia endophytica TaxID=1808945 RepID=A0ABV8H3W6_9FLAO|nr:Crp/Fnr family transcriptional regulator [Zunongwangia endophytica]MDN3595726.1 Crp/Fnr family transcriptional regulator [Zunongwangia endophytica]